MLPPSNAVKYVFIMLSAAGLFKYVWPFSGYQALKR